MPMKLVDEGYGVWMVNNRGTRYSNVNDNDISQGGTWDELGWEHWGFGF